MPDSYRPTLYDFVAHQALEFYNSGEQAAAKSEDAFELSADSPIFRPAGEFVGWKILTPAPLRGPQRVGRRRFGFDTLKAIRLYQDLLRFHQNDDDRAALLDADIERLSFGNNKAVGEEKTALYKVALQRFVKQWGDHPISAIARFRLAGVLQQEGALVEAHDLAQQGAQAFPNTPGGNLCYNLVKQIEAKSANIITERVWNEPSPSIRVTYRNLTKVYFRLVRQDWLASLKNGRYRGRTGWTTPSGRRSWRRSPIWPGRPTCRQPRTTSSGSKTCRRRRDLKPGFYYLLASHDAGFSASNNIVSYTDVWVSKLALVLAADNSEGRVRRFRARCGLGRADRRGRGAGLCLGLERPLRHGCEGQDRPQRPLLGQRRSATRTICSMSRTRARNWPRPTTSILGVNNYRPIPTSR